MGGGGGGVEGWRQARRHFSLTAGPAAMEGPGSGSEGAGEGPERAQGRCGLGQADDARRAGSMLEGRVLRGYRPRGGRGLERSSRAGAGPSPRGYWARLVLLLVPFPRAIVGPSGPRPQAILVLVLVPVPR